MVVSAAPPRTEDGGSSGDDNDNGDDDGNRDDRDGRDGNRDGNRDDRSFRILIVAAVTATAVTATLDQGRDNRRLIDDGSRERQLVAAACAAPCRQPSKLEKVGAHVQPPPHPALP